MPVALALSPHLDDAAFSCGGALALLAEAGWRVVVATAFTATIPNPGGFALACQLDKGLGPEIDYMQLRRREDAAAMAALGTEALWIDLPEAPHRGYGTAAELFGAVRNDDPIEAALANGLGGVMRQVRPDLLLAPQAIGGHVDHVQLVRALEALAVDVPCMWWRDFPYVAREPAPAEPFGDRMAALPELALRLGDHGGQRKRQACRAYASQLGFQFGGEAALGERLAATGGVEQFRAEGTLPPLLPDWQHERHPA